MAYCGQSSPGNRRWKYLGTHSNRHQRHRLPRREGEVCWVHRRNRTISSDQTNVVGHCKRIRPHHGRCLSSTRHLAMVLFHQFTVVLYLPSTDIRTGGFAIAVLVVFLKLNPTKRTTVREVIRTFDWLGLLLFVSGIVLFLTGLASGGNGTFGWTSGVVLGTLIPGGVCLVLAVVNE